MKRLASVKAEEEELQAGGDSAGTPETAQVTTLTLPTLDTMGVISINHEPGAVQVMRSSSSTELSSV